MTLCDAGPMVALIDRHDQHHRVCVAATALIPPGPMVTTWPCLTEAMHFLAGVGGFSSQDQLWNFVFRGNIVVYEPSDIGHQRTRDLMAKYASLPMSLADASLVLAAENLNTRSIFTVDSDFKIYRIHDKYSFDIVP